MFESNYFCRTSKVHVVVNILKTHFCTTRILPYIIFQKMLAGQSQRDWAISLIVKSGVTLPLSIPSPPQFEDPVVPILTISVRADIS
jgi:hypothetical protein